MAKTETFLDLSTAHLDARSRAWLSEAATLNHAASYHGHGAGAAISTLGATYYGWFLHVPEADTGAPAALQACMDHAKAAGCAYILFDADGPVDPDLPVYDDEEEDAL